jgi:hypothetical protein
MSQQPFNVYSFATFPEEHKPSGEFNLDRAFTFDVTQTIYDIENQTQTATVIGTIKLTPEEYTQALGKL